MISLNKAQRDFLDRYYTEYMRLEAGPAIVLGAVHGFYYEHLLALYEPYRQAWGGSFEEWRDVFPPVPASPLTFPWPSIQDLEAQLRAEGIEVIPLPRKRPTECPPSD